MIKNIEELRSLAKTVRGDIVSMLTESCSGHPGGSLSAADILTTLFFGEMNIDPKNPKDADRDRFVLSKVMQLLFYIVYWREEDIFLLRS